MARTVLIDSPWFVVERWQGTGTLSLPPVETMIAVCALGGESTICCERGGLPLRGGQSAVVPAACGALTIEGAGADLVATRSPL
jgi:mannose-6-phosphate isomerase class I